MTSKDSTCIVCENQFKNKSKDKKFCSMPCYRIAQKRGDYIGTKGTKLKYNCAHCAKEVLGKSKSTNRKADTQIIYFATVPATMLSSRF